MYEPLSKSRTGCDKTDDEQLFAGWQAHAWVQGGKVSAEVGLKEWNDDVKVLSCSQNVLTQIRFD